MNEETFRFNDSDPHFHYARSGGHFYSRVFNDWLGNVAKWTICTIRCADGGVMLMSIFTDLIVRGVLVIVLNDGIILFSILPLEKHSPSYHQTLLADMNRHI